MPQKIVPCAARGLRALRTQSATVIVAADYHGHRIESVATPVEGGRFNAVVHIRRTLSNEKPIVETVTCLKVSRELAEAAGERWAKRWIDLNASATR
jgi:hypothetical protein